MFVASTAMPRGVLGLVATAIAVELPHAPQLHVLLHVSVPAPPEPHDCVAPAAHWPWPLQVDQADHVPPLHVRVWVPQFPQVCDDAPVHVH
jgi:hypothetical protein